jgi:SagB-type dehydrogenase family enzyme
MADEVAAREAQQERREGVNVKAAAKTHLFAAALAVLAAAATGVCLSCNGSGAAEPRPSITDQPPVTDTPTVTLPTPRNEGPISVEAAIEARRSTREFSGEPLSLAEVGQLLWATQGITSAQGARAAPSAGGTYPLELYLAAGRVTGLEPGVYRYLPAQHGLVLVAAGDVRALLAEAALDQTWVAESAVDVVIAAVYARTTERYGERGIRYVQLEAGHAAENLCLQATALGLGAVTVGAFSDEKLATGVQMPVDQEPLYVIPVGHPASR